MLVKIRTLQKLKNMQTEPSRNFYKNAVKQTLITGTTMNLSWIAFYQSFGLVPERMLSLITNQIVKTLIEKL